MTKLVVLVAVTQALLLRVHGTVSKKWMTGPENRASCPTVAQVAEKLWKNDVNKLGPADLTISYQKHVSDASDRSSQRLFQRVDTSKLSGETWQTFLAMLDNYNPTKGQGESLTRRERAENSAFLDAILKTKIMDILLDFLTCRGIAKSQLELRSILTELWLQFYPREGTSAVNDTSGFEHVMVGEYKSAGSVNGLHNWLSFYQKEKEGEINYYGYVKKREPVLIAAVFTWNNRIKKLGSFFLGASPEFDMAVYTLCFLTYPGRRCPVQLNGQQFYIRTIAKDGHMVTAYPST